VYGRPVFSGNLPSRRTLPINFTCLKVVSIRLAGGIYVKIKQRKVETNVYTALRALQRVKALAAQRSEAQVRDCVDDVLSFG